MTVPIRNNIDVLTSTSRDILEYKLKMQGQAGGKDAVTFDTILKDAMSSAPTLDKEQINMLLFMMKMQMNERLFRVVTDDKKGGDFLRPFNGLTAKVTYLNQYLRVNLVLRNVLTNLLFSLFDNSRILRFTFSFDDIHHLSIFSHAICFRS